MRVTVFGATGPTGRQLLVASLNQGHQTRAFARRPALLEPFGNGIQIVSGDVLDRVAVRRAVAGSDVVVSSLGVGFSMSSTTVISEGTRALVEAMQAEGVRRLLIVTSAMVTPTGQEPWLFRSVGRWLLRKIHEDHLRAEEIVKTSQGIDWTIVRPPRLLDTPARGAFRLAKDQGILGGNEISRADLARFMVEEAVARRFVGCGVSIGY